MDLSFQEKFRLGFHLIQLIFLAELISCSMGNETVTIPSNLDHLVLTAPSLEQGMDHVENLLGVRPVEGGHHPGFGTHNALLSLGPQCYLEVIAPDPELPVPENGLLFEEYFKAAPKLSRWVLRTARLDELVSNAYQHGLDLGLVSQGSRETPEGAVLSWRLTDPSVIPLEGTIPFLIDWGNTSHPATSAVAGGKLVGFHLEHPQPELVRASLRLIGTDMKILPSREVRLVAIIETERGLVELF